MKNKGFRRILSLVLAVVVAASLMPVLDIGGKVKAGYEKWIDGLGTQIIEAPEAPNSGDDKWNGAYVWFGKYDGEPVRYRVLAPETTIYGGMTMLLDCDSVLYTAPFDADREANSGAQKPNEWKYSDVRAGLNGSSFLTKANGFTSAEKDAIAKSTIASHALVEGTKAGQVSSWTKEAYVNYVALSGEKIFLLDGEDVSNSEYGYYYDDNPAVGKSKKDSNGDTPGWWLRSERDGNADRVGEVNDGGALDSSNVDYYKGVSPAFNIDLSSVLFTSMVGGYTDEEGPEYTLTILDSDMSVGITTGKTGSISDSKITIPFTISGQYTRISVLILDKEYTPGNTNNAEVLKYSELYINSQDDSGQSGTGRFYLPTNLSSDKWGSSYFVYMFTEIENGTYETDYASAPVKLNKRGSTITASEVSTVPKITKQPISTVAAVGDKAKFSVTASGFGTLTYQWQYRRNENDEWKTSGQSGNKTATLKVSTTAGLHGYQFRCIVTDQNGKAVSNAVTLYLKPKITTQPEDTTAAVGNKAVFTVEATGKSKLTYQWQYRKNETDDWKTSGQSGNKTATLSVATTAGLHGYQFRCIVTDGNSQVSYSGTATLKVRPKITTWPKNTTAAPGTRAEFTVAATGKGTLKYQWQYRRNANDTWKTSGQRGNKTATLSVAVTAGLNGYQFRCYVTDANGQRSYTNTVTLTVSPRITTQPVNQSVTARSTVKFTVAAEGAETLTYQWQYRKRIIDNWTKGGFSGSKTETVTVVTQESMNGYQFRCVVKDGEGRETISDEVTLTVN